MSTLPQDTRGLDTILSDILRGGVGVSTGTSDPSRSRLPRRGGDTSLPDMVEENPDAYADLLGLDYKDPLAYYDTASGGEARGLGSSNGLVVYHKPDEGKGATAAILADIANRANNERLRRSMGGGQQPGSTPSQLGTLGDLAGLGLGYLKGVFDKRSQAQPTATPMHPDQYSRIFGGTGVTPEQAAGFGQPTAPQPQAQPAPQMQPQAMGNPMSGQMAGGLGGMTSGGGVTGAGGDVNWGQLLGAVIGGQR